MKTLLIAATALTLIGGSAAVAQPYGGYGYSNDRYERSYDRGYGQYGSGRGYRSDNRYDRGDNRYDRGDNRYERRSQRWARGDRLPSSYRSSRYAVDYRQHRLRAPPRGYRWQQVDNNYVLAAIATGVIMEIISGR